MTVLAGKDAMKQELSMNLLDQAQGLDLMLWRIGQPAFAETY